MTMPEMNINQLQSEKNNLQKQLEAFSQDAQSLEETIKSEKQEQLQKSFSDLEQKVTDQLQKENNEEIKKLQQEIADLKLQYKELLSQTKQETTSLQSGIENARFGTASLETLSLLENTPLKTRMLKVFSDQSFNAYPELKDKEAEERIEIVFRKINTVLTRFYARKLNISPAEQLPDYLAQVIVPATERFLMDMLKETGQETNVNFLGSLSTMSLESIGELFKGVNDFSKKFMLPFTKGKALLNLSDFLALPKNQAKLKKLNNPYEFYEKVMQDELWQKTLTADKSPKNDQISLDSITWEQFGLSAFQGEQSQEDLAQALQAGKEKIQQEIWTIEMVENPKTVQKMLGLLNKSDTFFAQTQKLSDQLLETINAPWEAFKTIKSVVGIDLWKELKESKLLWGVINFVLSLLGFSGGIEGVERAWKKKNIDKELKQPQKEYISEVYEKYMKKKTLQDTSAQSLLNDYKLKVDADQLSKFAIDLPLIKEQITEKITENPDLINLSTLKSIKGKNFKGENFVETIKEKKGSTLKLKKALSEEERAAFVDYYLQTMLEHFSKPKNSKMLADADSLVFTMISWVCLDKENVIEGVEAQIFLPEQFYEAEKKADSVQNQNEHTEIKNTNLELKEIWDLSTSELKKREEANKNINNNYKDIIEEASKDFGVPETWIKWIITQESGWNPNLKSSAGALWLMQLMPGTAREVWIDNPNDPRQNIRWWTKYFKKMYDKYNDLTLALAAYNAGPWKVDQAKNNVPNNKETKHYVDIVPKFIKKYESMV